MDVASRKPNTDFKPLQLQVEKACLYGLLLLAVFSLAGCGEKANFEDSLIAAYGAPQSGSETFKQTSDGQKIDILFVNDNSSSMYDEQVEVGNKFNSFSRELSGFDWQLGITTSDTSKGAYGLRGSFLTLTGRSEKILTPKIPQADLVFANTLKRPETYDCTFFGKNCPSSREKPVLAASLALGKSGSEHTKFFRDGADLAVIILSDEDEDPSATDPNAPAENTSAKEVVAQAKNLWGENKKVVFYGIVITPGDEFCLGQQRSQENDKASYSNMVSQVAGLSGGSLASICEDDYSYILNQMGQKIRENTRSVTLRFYPRKDTVNVEFVPQQSGISWYVVDKTVYFSRAPTRGTQIKVTYLHHGN